MRIDIFLHRTGLIRRRSQAREACQEGAVWVADHRAKPGRTVAVGDRLRIRRGPIEREWLILALPRSSLSRSAQGDHLELVAERRDEREAWLEGDTSS